MEVAAPCQSGWSEDCMVTNSFSFIYVSWNIFRFDIVRTLYINCFSLWPRQSLLSLISSHYFFLLLSYCFKTRRMWNSSKMWMLILAKKGILLYGCRGSLLSKILHFSCTCSFLFVARSRRKFAWKRFPNIINRELTFFFGFFNSCLFMLTLFVLLILIHTYSYPITRFHGGTAFHSWRVWVV